MTAIQSDLAFALGPDVPPHKLRVKITYLQMFEKPGRAFAAAPRADLSVIRAERPTLAFYKFLYNTVGAPWLWSDRRRLSDADLAQILEDPLDEVHVLYAAGVPAGYAELDRRTPGDVEIAYFGIMPEFVRQRLGTYLLDWAIERAWSYAPARLWLHTCTLDDPLALPTYRKAGFEVYKDQIVLQDDPRLLT